MTNNQDSKTLTSKKLMELIKKIQGVLDTKVTLDDQNFVQEIYVLADKSRGPKQIVRDIETASAVEFNVNLDHRKISVVQLSDNECLNNGGQINRLKLQNLISEFNNNIYHVSVVLNGENGEYKAQLSGISSERNQKRLVANAVLKAVYENYKENEGSDGINSSMFSLVLEEVTDIYIAGESVVVVAVTLVTASAEELLVGTSMVKKDMKESVARATLDAINRRLTFLK